MKHIIPYNQGASFNQNPYEAGLTMIMESMVDPKALEAEVSLLDRIESMIPESLKFDFELEMFLNRKEGTLAKHHQALLKGSRNLYESISGSIPKDIIDSVKEITESFKKITEKEKRRIFENIAADLGDIDMINTAAGLEGEIGSENFTDVAGEWLNRPSIDTSEEGSSGTWGKIKGFFSALTEGGSPIGILQFILDLVGLFGSFFEPVGMIADAINAIIYAIRGKWFLAVLSAIAAIIPLGGNIIKGAVQAGAKGGKGALEIGTAYFKVGAEAAQGTAKVTDDVVRIAANASPESLRHLDWIGRSAGPAVRGLSGFIGGFFDKFLKKLVSWIPFIGKPLGKFFESIGGYLGKIGKVSDNFVKDIPKITTAAQAKQLNNFFKLSAEEGAKIFTKGEDLIVKAGGKTEVLTGKVLANSEIFLANRYGKSFSKALGKTTAKNVRFFYSQMATLASVTSRYEGKLVKIGGRVIDGFTFTKKIPLFLGKQFLHWATGKTNFSEGESNWWGTAIYQDMARKRRDRNMKENPDAAWDVPLFNAYEEELDMEYIEMSNKVINDYAKTMNLPMNANVTYALNRDKDKLPKEVADYYDVMYSDIRQEIDAALDDWDADIRTSMRESVDNLKHIKSFRII
jgi:hypothetical protein